MKGDIAKIDNHYDSCTEAWTKGEAEGFFTEGFFSQISCACTLLDQNFLIEEQEHKTLNGPCVTMLNKVLRNG